VFVTKMPVIRIKDLAEVMIRELAPEFGFDPEDIETRVIGVKPGEKMYEELMNKEETRRTVELEKYYVVTPAFKSLYNRIEYFYPGQAAGEVNKPYNSEVQTPMSLDDLVGYLRKSGLLETGDAEEA